MIITLKKENSELQETEEVKPKEKKELLQKLKLNPNPKS